VLLFYAEDLKSTGLSLDDLYHRGYPTDVWVKLQKGLEARAYSSFRITGLSADGEPIVSSWVKIRGK
jgi:hypothetical protein